MRCIFCHLKFLFLEWNKLCTNSREKKEKKKKKGACPKLVQMQKFWCKHLIVTELYCLNKASTLKTPVTMTCDFVAQPPTVDEQIHQCNFTHKARVNDILNTNTQILSPTGEEQDVMSNRKINSRAMLGLNGSRLNSFFCELDPRNMT